MAERPKETEDRSELQSEDTLDGVREQVWERQGLKGLEEVSENETHEHATEKGEKERAPEEGGNEKEDEAGSTNEGSSSHDNSTDHAYESVKTATGSFGEQAPDEDGKEATPDPPPEEGVEAKNSRGAGEDYLRDVSEEGKKTDGKPPEIDTIEPEPAPAEVESYSRNDNQVVVTEYKGSESPDSETIEPVQISDLQHFQPDAEQEQKEEPRTFEAVDYGKGANVRLPKTDLEEAGYDPSDHDAVVQVGLRNIEEDDVETVFARFNASDRRAEAHVADIGGEKGSKYELVDACEVDEDKLVRDFEKGRCEHLQNVRLEYAEDKMFLNVDDRSVELEGYHLSTSGSHLVLRGRLDGDDSCKIEFDGRRTSIRFGRDYPVEGMRMEGDDLVVSYAQSRNERHEHVLYLQHLETPERPSLSQFDRPEMKDHVKMFDHPDRIEGLYQFVVDKETQNEIGRLLQEAEQYGKAEFGMMKAEISERLVPNMFELVGWERLKRHPFSKCGKEGASANDTDWLLRSPDGREAIVEIKWWADTVRAESRGKLQLAEDLEANRRSEGKRVGAYLMIVDWKIDDSPIKVYVKRVDLEEVLA